jgi:polysaccharide export outer membrane protein
MLYFDAAEGVRAGGKTVAQVEEALAEQLSDVYSFPVVSANMYDVQGNRFTVLGQVKNPGSYPLRQPTTLIDAIASAGGLHSANLSGKTKDLADLGRSVLIRDGKMMSINFRKLIEGGDMAHNVYMKPGDYVFLPATGKEKVYVLGSVNSPTAFPYSSRVTLISAVAAARGIKQEAYASGLVLIRGSFDEPKLAGVNLRKILRGEELNFHLLPGDIIWVPKKPWSKLSEYAELALASVATSVALNESYELFGETEADNTQLGSDLNTVEVQPEAQPEEASPEPEPFVPAPEPDPVFIEPVVADPGPVL